MKERTLFVNRHSLAAFTAASLGASALTVALTATPAAADGCSYAVCTYTGVSYGGTQTNVTAFNSGTCESLPATLSAHNAYGQTVSLYDFEGYKIVSVANGYSVQSLADTAYYVCLGENSLTSNHNEIVLTA